MSVTEQPHPAASPVRHAQTLIADASLGSLPGDTADVENPTKPRKTIDIRRRGGAEVDRAVQAANLAFPAWSKVPPRDRGWLVLRVAEALWNAATNARA